MRVKKYQGLEYVAVELEDGEQLPMITEKYARLSVPAGMYRYELMTDGYIMVDRTIEVKVPIARSKIEFQKFCRMNVNLTDADSKAIYQVAQKSFHEDCRFQVTLSEERENLAAQILNVWLEEQKQVFQCKYKEQVVGFADVRYLDEYKGQPFIYLAAVDEKYRVSGAAMSLYASVFEYYKKLDTKFVYGRISSRNMAVMNLYATFGAQFAQPYDIYIKK